MSEIGNTIHNRYYLGNYSVKCVNENTNNYHSDKNISDMET